MKKLKAYFTATERGLSTLLFALALVVVFAACRREDDPEIIEDETETIVDLALENPNFSSLVAALQKADLVDAISGDGPFTVFAPTNDAFSALFAELGVSGLDDLSAEALTPILTYHVVASRALAGDLSNGGIETLNGRSIYVNVNDGVRINGTTRVTDADIVADNGVIHVIDRVLLPATQNVVEIAQGNEDFSSLVAAVVQAELAATLSGAGPFTVFAPTNAAFEELLTELGTTLEEIDNETLTKILLYHVVSGRVFSSDLVAGDVATLNNGQTVAVGLTGGATLNGDVNIVATDIKGTNGVVHVIDKVLVPGNLPEEAPIPNLVEAATEAGLTTLLNAVEAAGVGQALLDAEEITVFAPTNAAFAALIESLDGVDDLDDLVEFLGGVEGLINVLQFHVLPTAIFAEGVPTTPTAVETLNGESITVVRDGETVSITDLNGNTYTVVAADVEIQNGVVHVIDGVLLPTLSSEETRTLTLREDGDLGLIFADANGRALYYFARDINGLNNCSGGCASNWPIFFADNIDINNPAFDSELIGTIQVNGESQTTYNGWPLYYFANDTDGNSINGDGVGSVWFAAKPDYSIMVANGQLVGNDGESYIINEAGEYVTGTGNTQYFVDFATGRTLYRFINDDANQSNFGGNPSTWPKYNTAVGQLPSIIDAAELGTIAEEQISFRGNPVYRFGSDQARGETKGVSVPSPGVWPIINSSTPILEPLPTLVEAATEAGLTTLLNAVEAAGVGQTLLDAEEITVFAPTNDAFAALIESLDGVSNLDELVAFLGGTEGLANVLQYHVLPSKILAAGVPETATEIATLNGEIITVIRSGNTVTITDVNGGQVTVSVADVEIANGVVHVITGVLLPDLGDEEEEPAPLPNLVEAATEAGLTTLLDAVEAAGVGQALLDAEEITVFAPTNAAFTALIESLDGVSNLDELVAFLGGTEGLANVLQYHVLPSKILAAGVPETATEVTTLNGETITVIRSGNTVTITDVNGGQVTVSVADVEIANGVVHVITGVLLPDLGGEEEEPAPLPNLVEAATEAGLTTLLDAVEAAGVGQALLDAEEITVFAPTNAAFTALIESLDGVSNLDELVAFLGGTEGLANVLQYHVLPSKILAAGVPETATAVGTLNGETITVIRSGNTVTITDVNGGQVTVSVADVEIANGVVHVITGVLLPDLSED